MRFVGANNRGKASFHVRNSYLFCYQSSSVIKRIGQPLKSDALEEVIAPQVTFHPLSIFYVPVPRVIDTCFAAQ